MIPLCVIEVAYVLLVHRPIFGTMGEALRFSLYLVMLLVCGGAVLGAVEGLVSLGVSTLTQLLAKRRVAEPRWMAWLYSLLALPVIAVGSALVFSGRRAQQIPGKHLIALGLGLVALLGTYVFLRLVIGARDRFRIRRWEARQALLLAPALLLVAVALYVADQRVLVRLYTFFHVGLALGTVAFCQLAAGAVYMGFRPRSRWMGRLADPSVALLLFVAGVAGVAWSLNRIGRWETLRAVYYRDTVIQAKVLSLASKLKMVQGAGDALQPTRPPEPIPESSLRPGPRTPEANLLLISVDAMRADHMGVYGYGRNTTPNLDRWARRSVLFERGYCQVPHTSFSVTSLMTGTYVYSASRANPGRRFRTMAEAVRRYGYKTAAFFPPAVFYIDRDNFTAFERSKFGFEYVKYEYLPADKRVDQAIAFLREQRAEARRGGDGPGRFFAWLHLFEPHEPYELHAGHDFGPRGVDRYDSEIAFVDQHLGRLFRYVQEHFPNTVIALTADHGEEFGEHGGHYHGNALYDQQVRVPLVIGAPGVEPRRVDGAAQIIDLPVTMLSLVDVPVSAEMTGNDLGPWLAGEDAASLPPAFCEMDQQKFVVKWDHKLLCDTSRGFCELYDLKRDPLERRNLISREPRLADRLRQRLTTWMASHSIQRSGEEDEEAEITGLLDRARQRDVGAIPELVKLGRTSLELRRRVVRLLTQMRATPARAALVQATSDTDPGVRMQATIGAAMLGHAPSLARLPRLLARPDLPPGMRRDALLALARAGDRRATRPLARVLEESGEIYERVEIVEALGNLGDPAAAPALFGQLKTLRTRLVAIEALGKVGARTAVSELLRGLANDRFVSWRRAAAQALGRIGDRRAVGTLQHAVRQDLEGEVVADALQALSRLGGLPVPGVPELRAPRGSCPSGAPTCEIDLGGSCAMSAPRDLLVAFGGRGTGRVTLFCGSREVDAVDVGPRRTAAIHLSHSLPGALRLRVPSGVTLSYAALRPMPRSPRAASEQPGG